MRLPCTALRKRFPPFATAAVAGVIGLLLATATPATGQSATSGSSSLELTRQLQGRLADAQAELDRLRSLQSDSTNPRPGSAVGEATEYRLLTESLVLVYQQHLDELGRLETAPQRLRELDQTSRAASESGAAASQSILVIDGLRDSVEILAARVAAVETARAVLVLILVVFSLISVKIPLTVFAFLGGALAIGLGFGTQNLLKNFISGIIILFALPFRVNVREHNAAQVCSDLRHMIAGAFAERGIVIAFPQRDVHLDAAAPLRMQVMPVEKGGPSVRLPDLKG